MQISLFRLRGYIVCNFSYHRIKVLVTSQCNSTCKHCFRSLEKNSESLSKDEIFHIIDYGIENDCNYFSFSGGEFFTHPAAYDIITYCMVKDVRIDILTNGLEIDLDYFSKNSYQRSITFQVSVDGLEHSHDMRRGEGSYKRTMGNVKELHKMGYQLRAKTVLDETNYKDIIEIMSLPWFFNIAVLPVAKFTNTVMGPQDPVVNEEYESVIEFLYRKNIAVNSSGFICNHFPNELAIKYNGDVFPCTEAREHGYFLIGNIRKTPIKELISKYVKDEASIPCSNIVVAKCQSCEHLNICKQGCRLRALRYHGSLLYPDPFACRIFRGESAEVPIGRLIWGEKN